MDTTKTVISLCTGYGGIELGLRIAGIDVRAICMVEREAFAISNLVDKMEKGELHPAPVWTDVTTFNARPFRNKVDILVGGLPCQPVSTAGKRKGSDDPRWLWDHGLRIISECRPQQVFFENVEGFVTKGLRDVLCGLEERGYKATWGIFSAREVGAPHLRKRVFILGNLIADTNIGRQQEHKRKISTTPPYTLFSSTNFPTSIDQPQREWEPPRAVNGVMNADWEDTYMGLRPGWTGEGELSSNRIDRLRLNGNGVVPQTACKAWVVLNDRFK